MGSCTLSRLLGAAMRCKYSSAGDFLVCTNVCVYKCVRMSTVLIDVAFITS